MASILGNRTDPVERTGFPGEGGLERRQVANETDIDLAVRTLLDEALDRATAILTEQGSGVQAAWRLRDGLDLVVEVQARAARRADGAIGWENLQRARARSGLGLNEILRAIRDGRLQVGQQAGSDGWRSFRVRKAEIDRMARPRDRMAHLLP